MRGVKSLSGLAGPGASLAQAGGDEAMTASAAVFLTVGTVSWVVPDGVTKVSMVCIGSGASDTSGTYVGASAIVARGAIELCRGLGGSQTGVSNVGDAFYAASSTPQYSVDSILVTFSPGGGGNNCYGISLFGEDANGKLLTVPGGYSESSTTNYYYGGRPGGAGRSNRQAGNVAWANEISVTPGETLTITVPNHGNDYDSSSSSYTAGEGGVAICWGAGGYPRLLTVPQNVIYY